MPNKKENNPSPPTPHEKEIALEEKEIQLEERKLAVWKQKFDFIKSAGRDTIILVTGLVGTVGGGAIRGYLEKLFPADGLATPPLQPGDIASPSPTVAPSNQVTLTPPHILFGKGNVAGSGQGYSSGAGKVGSSSNEEQYQTVAQTPYRHQRNQSLYLTGHALWIFFMLLVVWGVWKRFRKGKIDATPTDQTGKSSGQA